MAASCLEKDYVHILVEKVKAYDQNVAFGIAQVAEYERDFLALRLEDRYQKAADFHADIIIMFFGANVSRDYPNMENPEKTFGQAVEDLRNFLNPDNKAKVFISEGFYIKPKLEEEKKILCSKYGDTFISLGDIPYQENTHGDYNHPNDLGMQAIADTFWCYLEPEIKQNIKMI